MTDEEKEKTEKEYKEWLVYDHKLLDNPTSYDIEQKCFRAFFAGTRYGLEEGRKEGYEQGKNNERELQCGKKNYEKDISKLKKENAELMNTLEKTMPLKLANQLKNENAELNRDKIELTNSVTELKTKVTELEAQLKNNPYVELLQKEKAEMAENFAKQIEKMKNKLNCVKYHYCLCKDKTCKDCKDWKLDG